MNPTRGVLSNITYIPASGAASIVAAAATVARGGMMDNSPLMGLPSPLKEPHQRSHHAQVNKTNTQKNKDAYNLTSAWATKLVAKERKKEKGEGEKGVIRAVSGGE